MNSLLIQPRKNNRIKCVIGLTLLSSIVCAATPAYANKHSIIFALDGLRGDGITNASTPNIDRLINGTWAPNYKGAFAHYAQTMTDAAPNSGPNHVGIMTGVTATKSRVTNNSNIGGGNYTDYPHYQTIIENHNSSLNTAYLVTWSTDMQIANNADLKVDSTDAGNTQRAVEIINGTFSSTNWPKGTQPDSVFFFIDAIDSAGHGNSFDVANDNYIAAINKVDGQVGQVLDAIKSRPNFSNEDWQVIITSDHGGRGSSHGINHADNYTIPFLVVSKDVNQGYLEGVPNNFDAAPTALAHLGIDVPANMDGIVRGANTQPSAPEDIGKNIVTYIPFDGDYHDHSGHEHHGSVGGGRPELKTAGKFGGHVSIDGSSEYVTLGGPSALDFGTSKDFTLFTWYRVSGDQKGDPVIISNKNWDSGSNRGVALIANASEGNGDDVGINIASSANDRKDFQPIDYSFNGWWMLAATFDRDGAATLYAGSPQGQLKVIAGDISDIGDLSSSLNWNIGQDGTGSYKYNLKADLDDFAVWQRALSLDEIRTIFNHGNGIVLSQLLAGIKPSYLDVNANLVVGEQYRVAITSKAEQANCGVVASTDVNNAEVNAYFDCSGKTTPLIMQVNGLNSNNNGELVVSAMLIEEKYNAGLEWDSSSQRNERNAKFDRNSAGDPVIIKLVTDANNSRIFANVGNDACGFEWDSSISSNQRNAKWDCAGNSDPMRLQLLGDKVSPPVEPAKLIAHYPLAQNANDISGNNYNGSISGNIAFTNQYAEFDNATMITMASGSNLPNLPTQAMTISAWVNIKSVDTWGGFTGLLQDNGSFEKGWLLGTRGQKFSFALASVNTKELTYLQDINDFKLNRWYHIAASYDGSEMKLYLDGQLTASSTAQSGAIDMPKSGWWQIGSYKDDNEDFRHEGGLSQIKLFDKALSSEEILQLMATPPVNN